MGGARHLSGGSGRTFREARPWRRLCALAVAGSVAGAVLLLLTPEKAFTAVVPVLIGLATILFAVSGRVREWIATRATRGGSSHRLGMALFAPVAVYGATSAPG